ncbi:hypothetical protein JCM16303_003159 [Sporobolomyces ruberrimus]
MPVTSYFPPDHDRPPPVPVFSTSTSPPSSPQGPSRRRSTFSPPLPRSSSSQLSIPQYATTLTGEPTITKHPTSPRRRSSALTDLDEEAIKQLSARAREAERRAQWEGSKLLNLEPPKTPPPTSPSSRRRTPSYPTTTTAPLSPSSSSSIYGTPSSTANRRTPLQYDGSRTIASGPPLSPTRSSRSPRSPRSREHSYANSIRSNHSTSSNLSAVSEFLAEEEPPNSRPHTPSFAASPPPVARSTSTTSRRSRISNSSQRISTIFPSTSSSSNPNQNQQIGSPRSSFDSSSSSSRSAAPSSSDDELDSVPISSTFAPRLVKTTHETDQFVRLLDREKQGVIERRNQLERDRLRRERGRTESSGKEKGGGSGTDHERSESGQSDASFASMTATMPSQLRESMIKGEDGLRIGGGSMGRGGYEAPGMERNDTLKASNSSGGGGGAGFDPNSALRENGGGVKSIEEILKGYKALEVGGIVERRRSSVATIQIPTMTTRKDASLEEYQYPTPMVSPEFDTFRPLSPNSFTTTNSSTSSSNGLLLPYVPFPTPPNSATVTTPTNEVPGKIKSIAEIIAQHAGNSYRPPSATAKIPSPTTSAISAPATTTIPGSASTANVSTRTRELSQISSASETSTRDSIDREVARSLLAGGRDTPALALDPTPTADSRSIRTASIRSVSLHSPSPRSTSPLPPLDSPSPSSSGTASQELSLLLKSPRLTRLLTLSRPGPSSGLTVSLSDVGSSTGHPVLIFLGLGSVRYLLALYDELAEIFGLRLICIDRWGLGKTSSVPDSKRGFSEWSKVVEEVVEDHLGIDEYSILAHSAGAPYAVATALSQTRKSKGTIHLLAPWVVGGGPLQPGGQAGMSADNLAGMYKYLKYVPSGVLKTAQAAEWKIQGWRLGKGPIEEEGTNGIDVSTIESGRRFEESETTPRKEKRESLASLGIVGSGEVVDKLEQLYPEGGIRLAGPHVGSATPSRGGNTPRRKGSLSVNGKSLFGGIFASGGSTKSNRSTSGDDASSLRPSLASTNVSGGGGRRSSYFAASAINARSTPPPPSIQEPSRARASGLPTSATPTSAKRSSLLPDRSTSPPSPRNLSSLSTPSRFRPDSVSSASSSYRPSSPSLLLSPTSPTTSNPTTTRSTISPSLLISGLLRASHAESLSGSTSDLLVLLDRSNNNNSSKSGPVLAYNQVEQPVQVWYGDRDDRMNETSMRWLEREMRDCKIRIVKGADHNLMTNHQVMFDVLESISKEVERRIT